MEAIRATASRGMHGIGRGGVEVGGVLLGVRIDDFLRVLDWREIPCEHSRGPSFLFSADELARLQPWIEELEREAGRRDLQIIGWFVSHTRSSLDLTSDELEIHARHFVQPWQLALVIEPSKFGDIEGRFYRRASESPDQLDPLEPVLAVAPLPVEVKAKNKPRGAPVGDLPPEPDESTPGRRVSRIWPVLAVAVLAILAIASIAVGVMPGVTERITSYFSSTRLDPYESVSLRAAMTSPGSAEISWNGDVAQSRGVNRATLEVKDGGKSVRKDLSTGELYMGRISYPIESPRLDVILTLYDGEVVVGRESTQFRRPKDVTSSR